MDKKRAILIFGSVAETAKALGVSRQAIHAWPNELEQHTVDRLIGAAIRTGRLPGLIESGLRSRESA